jgi:hypothetical protein
MILAGTCRSKCPPPSIATRNSVVRRRTAEQGEFVTNAVAITRTAAPRRADPRPDARQYYDLLADRDRCLVGRHLRRACRHPCIRRMQGSSTCPSARQHICARNLSRATRPGSRPVYLASARRRAALFSANLIFACRRAKLAVPLNCISRRHAARLLVEASLLPGPGGTWY